MIKRKWLMAVIAIATAISGFFTENFGIVGFGSILIAITYVFGEFKNDIKRIGLQIGRFKDPVFLLSFIGTVLPTINQNVFNGKLPEGTILTVLGVILPIIIGIFLKRNKDLNKNKF
jgi:hypothetical protein